MAKNKEKPKIEFYLIDIAFHYLENRTQTLLFGKTINGEDICAIDNEYQPYFYAVPTKEFDILKVLDEVKNYKIDSEHKYKILDVKIENKKVLNEKRDVLKIVVNHPYARGFYSKYIENLNFIEQIKEHDLSYTQKYLIDKDIIPLNKVQMSISSSKKKLRVTGVIVEDIKPVGMDTLENIEDFKVIAYKIKSYNPDLDIDSKEYPIMCISLFSPTFSKVITWKKANYEEDNIEIVRSEADMILRFKEIVGKYNPEIMVGYNSDNYDMRHLIQRAQKYKIYFNFAKDFTEPKVLSHKIQINGIAHLDIKKFLGNIFAPDFFYSRPYFYEVANKFLEKEDLIEIEDVKSTLKNKGIESKIYRNIVQAKIIYKLFGRLIKNYVEIVKTAGQTLSDINCMRYYNLIEVIMMRQAYKDNVLIQRRKTKDEIKYAIENREKSKLLKFSKPGIYRNKILRYQFKNYYASIISAHNISPTSLNCQCCQPLDVNCSDDFCKEEKSFIQTITGDFISRIQRLNEILIKTNFNPYLKLRLKYLNNIVNSIFNYLINPATRWYNPLCAKAIKEQANKHTQKIIDLAKEMDYNLIYIDNDSILFEDKYDEEKNIDLFMKQVSDSFKEPIIIEKEQSFVGGIFFKPKYPFINTVKYVIMDKEERLFIKKRLPGYMFSMVGIIQKGIVDIILKNRDYKEKVYQYIRKEFQKIKRNESSKKNFVLRKIVRKNIEDYKKEDLVPKIANELKKQGKIIMPGTILEYLMVKGRENENSFPSVLINDVMLSDIDFDFYFVKTIVPLLDEIFVVTDLDVQDLFGEKNDVTLDIFYE